MVTSVQFTRAIINKFDLLKSHIAAYTRKNGTVVQAHDDKRQKATIKDGKLTLHHGSPGAVAAYETKVFKVGDNKHSGHDINTIGRQKSELHRDAINYLGMHQNYLLANGFRAKTRTGGADGKTGPRSGFGSIQDGDTHHEANFEHPDGRKTTLSWKADKDKHVVSLSHDPDAPAKAN